MLGYNSNVVALRLLVRSAIQSLVVVLEPLGHIPMWYQSSTQEHKQYTAVGTQAIFNNGSFCIAVPWMACSILLEQCGFASFLVS